MSAAGCLSTPPGMLSIGPFSPLTPQLTAAPCPWGQGSGTDAAAAGGMMLEGRWACHRGREARGRRGQPGEEVCRRLGEGSPPSWAARLACARSRRGAACPDATSRLVPVGGPLAVGRMVCGAIFASRWASGTIQMRPRPAARGTSWPSPVAPCCRTHLSNSLRTWSVSISGRARGTTIPPPNVQIRTPLTSAHAPHLGSDYSIRKISAKVTGPSSSQACRSVAATPLCGPGFPCSCRMDSQPVAPARAGT